MPGHGPKVMGVVNVTPDSFSDGGLFAAKDQAVSHALALVEEGADILDVGGESTRPGSRSVSLEEELDRVIPVVEAVRARTAVPISVDTSKPAVMRAAVHAGADIINDVLALQEPEALETAVDLGVTVCLMHMQGRPRTMQHSPTYDNVVEDVCAFFEERIETCVQAGLPRSLLQVDPGFGFGKTLEHNLTLLSSLPRFKALGLPVLVGLSRKSMFGDLLGLAVTERRDASISAAAIAVMRGADIVRAHDVRGTVHAVKLAAAIRDRISGYAENFAN